MTRLGLVLLALAALAHDAACSSLQSRSKRAAVQLGNSSPSSYCQSLLDMADTVSDINQTPLLEMLINQACSNVVFLPDEFTTQEATQTTTTKSTTTSRTATATTTTANPSTRTCGTITEAASSLRVINGQRVAVGEYKFLVTLLKNDQVVCTATIIDPTHVMTAAHCTRRSTAEQLSVGIAEHDITKNDGEKIIKVKTLTQHSGYNHANIVNDISVLTLAEPITGIKNAEPVCLPVDGQCENLNGMQCVVAGWGATSQQGGFSSYPNFPYDATVVTYDGKSCPHRNSAPSDQNTQICAAGESDTCEGDSGGPLVCQYGGRWVQCGVTSYGAEECNAKDTQGIYTKVPAYDAWIKSALAK
ncbi:thrombin-like enzyme acutin [Haliotis rubra]|uniref:thrombin-like enzyme acutin n=1 Tax=Haliotis rubra TaxID=36100 RepID=UPI001EE5809D|nr:thrombin-like enzyme acutin [Haliotis rubra]